jgi:hypothetical protein
MNINNFIKFALLIIFINTLSARDNPFVPTKEYLAKINSKEKPKEIVKPTNPINVQKIPKIVVKPEEVIAVVKDQEEEKIQTNEVIAKVIKPVEPVKPVQEPKLTINNNDIFAQKIKALEDKTAKMEEIILNQPKNTTNKNSTKQPQKISKTYKYHLLDFVKIDITNDVLHIKTKYKLKEQFVLEDENKIVCDFVSYKKFYTKRESVSSHQDFAKIAIGAHPESHFFRVVIKTSKNLKNYNIKISDNGTININKK